ncbi:hypothetical protein BJX63DRAFT_444063 [Aspergillus granulosus]|uniref:Uncharacterized protein n=1 Tax=Aspergillus granulosus TaxID=176169 RepID=A0ABR4H7S9_9EURO
MPTGFKIHASRSRCLRLLSTVGGFSQIILCIYGVMREAEPKCDEARPSCSQCIPAEAECPGEEVMGKARRQGRKSASGSGRAGTTPRAANLAYMSNLAKNPQNSAVSAALTAVGLVVMLNIRMAPQLLLAARCEYATALSRTNFAPVTRACQRGMILSQAVVLLGMFEVTICTDGSFFDRWMKHMDGAAKLIELRGSEQLGRPEGLQLFTQLRAQINISRICQERPSPPIIAQLTSEAKRYCTPEDQVYDVFSTILRLALKLDAELMAIAAAVPILWRYQAVSVPRAGVEGALSTLFTPDIWGDLYHVYSNISISSPCNHYRAARLMIHECIIDTVKELEGQPLYAHMVDEYRSLRNRSQQMSHQLVEDITASVPFHLGTAATGTNETRAAFISTNSVVTHVSSASRMALVWPLLIATNSGFASRELRMWIIAVLEKVGYTMGLNQALAMARLLHEGMKSRAWLEPGYTSSTSPEGTEPGY